MMRSAKRFSAVVALGLGVGLMSARALAVTTYQYNYIAGQGSYSVTAGGNVTVPLYLQEINSDQSSNSLLASEHGLSEAGVSVSYLSGSAANTITAAAANSGSVPTGFDVPTPGGTVNSITSATIEESTNPAPFGTDAVGVEPGTQINGVSEVYLGTVTIHGGGSIGQTTIFTAGVADPMNSNTFTNDNTYDLDNGSSSMYTDAAGTNFSVSIVPEPSALSLVALGGVLLLLRPRFPRPVTVKRRAVRG